MRLNLGCGGDIRPGYVNVDFRQLTGVDQVVDLSVFPWPYQDSSVDEILMLDFLEHFPYRQTERILLECFRIMADDGTVVIQVPAGEQLARAFIGCGEYFCNSCGHDMLLRKGGPNSHFCPKCQQTADEISAAAMRRMYGGQDFPGNFHHVLFTRDSLEYACREAGLELLLEEEAEHQALNWNMRFCFKKGDPWQ